MVDLGISYFGRLNLYLIEAFLPGLDQSLVDHSTEEWLDTIEDRLDYQSWYCGHWHIDKRIDKLHFMMRGVEAM